MAKAKKQLTEGEVLELIARRSEYSWGYFLTQVGVDGRIADAVWLNPSHLTLTGFEVKCARGDWIKELRDPWKWYAVGKFCDQWFLVVSARDIIKPGELPDSWGLMVCEGPSTKILRRAPKNPEPEQWNRELLAALLTKVRPPHEPDDLTKARKEGWSAGYRQGLDSAESRQQKARSAMEEKLEWLQEKHRRFEEITGVSISSWNMEQIAEDLKVVKMMTRGGLRSQGIRYAEQCESVARTIRETIAIAEENDGESMTTPMQADGLPGSLREIARSLVRFDSTLRKAATNLDGLQALTDCPLPSIEESLLHRAARTIEPVVGLLGPMLTIGLTRRVARALQEMGHAKEENEARGGAMDRPLLPG